MNTSIQSTPEDYLIEAIVAFPYMLDRRTGIRIESQKIRHFQRQNLNFSVFRDNLHAILECKKCATEISQDMFQKSGFQGTYIQTARLDGKTEEPLCP